MLWCIFIGSQNEKDSDTSRPPKIDGRAETPPEQEPDPSDHPRVPASCDFRHLVAEADNAFYPIAMGPL